MTTLKKIEAEGERATEEATEERSLQKPAAGRITRDLAASIPRGLVPVEDFEDSPSQSSGGNEASKAGANRPAYTDSGRLGPGPA